MLYLTLKKKQYCFPTSWKDITPEKFPKTFVRICTAMADFEEGLTDFDTFKTALTVAILGLRNVKVSEFNDTLSENIFRLSEQFTFPYILRERQDGITVCELSVILSDNILPEIRGKKGYLFHYDPSGRMDCDLTAERYIDALSLMQAWQNSRQFSALESLARTLYPGLKEVSREEALAVYYNFRGILAWIRIIPAYALIFTAPESAEVSGKNPVGLASSIYSLAKAGYGSINTVKDLPLFDYLDLLLQQSIESIRTLAAAGMKPVQVAERLGLPTDLVLEYAK